MDWIFDGIGTQVISIISSLIIGIITGGGVGYKIGVKKTIRQIQKAGKNSSQEQRYIRNEKYTVNKESYKENGKINQVQKAGDNSVQIQVGGDDSDR